MIEYDASFLYSSLFLTRRLIKASRVLHLVSPSTKHALDLSRKTEGCIAIARAKWKRMEQHAKLTSCAPAHTPTPRQKDQQPSLFHLAPQVVIIGFTRFLIQVHGGTHWFTSSQYASRCSVHLLWFSHYEVCYDHCGRFPYSHWRADQSVASSDTTCCPVEAEEIPLARCRSMMVHLTREMSCPSPNSCGYRRTMSSGCRPQ